MNLTFHLVENEIDRFVHIIRFFDTTKNDAVYENCSFTSFGHIGNTE